MSRYPDEYDDRGGRDDRDDGRDDSYDDRGDAVVERARQQVKAPAITMLVLAILSLVFVPLNVISIFTLPAQFQAQREQIDDDPNMQPAQKQQMKDFLKTYEDIVTKILPVSIALQAIVGILCVVGSLKMMKLSSRGWAMTTAILNIVMIGQACCCINLGIGIWALMVLGRPDVKAAFARGSAPRGEY